MSGSSKHYQTMTQQIAIERSKGYFLSLVLVLLWIAAGWLHPVINLSENQALYIFSSQAQVIAAVYGLTITGYIFLQNQQDRKSEADESLVEVMSIVRKAQHSYVTFLTILSISAIVSALLAIAFREHEIFFYRVVTQNSAVAFFCLALVFTSRFVRDSMQPDKVANISDKLKRNLEFAAESKDETDAERVTVEVEVQDDAAEDNGHKVGAFEQFFKIYNRIERSLEIFADEYLDERRPSERYGVNATLAGIETSMKRRRPTWTKSKIVRAMYERELIDHHWQDQLLEIIHYRNALAHGNDFNVPDDMLHRVTEAASVLENALTIST
jgi:low affinity Fe/Cu permease